MTTLQITTVDNARPVTKVNVVEVEPRHMKVLVLGATGKTGQQIVRDALEKGYSVVVLVRSKVGAPDLAGANVIEGDARDESALSRALDGCDAVVRSLGTGLSPFREVTMLSVATRALVASMTPSGVRRLVCITG